MTLKRTLLDLIGPYISSRGNADTERERQAKKALLRVATVIRSADHVANDELYHLHTQYLPGLERIFFSLQERRYCGACSALSLYLQENDINVYRVQLGLMVLLQHIEKEGVHDVEA